MIACCERVVQGCLRVANHSMLVFGALLVFSSIYVLGKEQGGVLGWMGLWLAVMNLLTATCGVNLAQSYGRLKARCYLALLVLLLLPERLLIGGVLADPDGLADLLSSSCASFEYNVWQGAKDSEAPSCAEQMACMSTDFCDCLCNERCRICQVDTRSFQAFAASNYEVVAIGFLVIGIFQGLALAGTCLYQLAHRDGGEEPIGNGHSYQRDDRDFESIKKKYRQQLHNGKLDGDSIPHEVSGLLDYIGESGARL